MVDRMLNKDRVSWIAFLLWPRYFRFVFIMTRAIMPIVLFWYLSVIIAFIQVRDIGDENFNGLHTCDSLYLGFYINGLLYTLFNLFLCRALFNR